MSDVRLPPTERLLGCIMQFMKYGSTGNSVRVAAEHADAFLVVYSMTQRVRRYARAYLQLGRLDMTPSGRPLVRAALEHAVTAQWVFYTSDGMERFKIESQRDQVGFLRAIADLDEEHPDVRATRDSIPPGPGLQKWKQILEALDDDAGFLSKTYRVLSQSVHVTHAVYLDAFHVGPKGEVALKDAPEDHAGPAVLYALTASCLMSWWLEAVCRGDDERMTKLADYGQALNIPWRLDNRLPEQLVRVGSR